LVSCGFSGRRLAVFRRTHTQLVQLAHEQYLALLRGTNSGVRDQLG
jgi:hypothetical protein